MNYEFRIMNCARSGLRLLAIVALSFIIHNSQFLLGQQPQAPAGTPLFATNAKYVNGMAPGYWPTAGSGLTLNLTAGSAVCNHGTAPYAGSSLTMAASATNYVYLDLTNNCAPASNTTGFSDSTIPIAVVTTGASAITAITDSRTWFQGAQVIGNVAHADRFPGADAGAKISAAIALLPAAGGSIDARGLKGSQTISSAVNIDKPVRLLLGATTITSTGTAFNITSTGVSIIGAGPNHTLIQTTSTSPLITNSGTNAQGSTLQGIFLAGPTSGSGSSGLIDLVGVNTFTLRNISTSGGIYGFHIKGSWDLWAENIIISSSITAALFLDGGTTGTNTAQSHFKNMDLTSSQGDGLLISASSGGQVDANSFYNITSEDNQGIGFNLQSINGSNSFYQCEAVDNRGAEQWNIASSNNRFFYVHGERTTAATSVIYLVTGSQNTFFCPRGFRGVPDTFQISGQFNALYYPSTTSSGTNAIHLTPTSQYTHIYSGILQSEPVGIQEDSGSDWNVFRDINITGQTTAEVLNAPHDVNEVAGSPFKTSYGESFGGFLSAGYNAVVFSTTPNFDLSLGNTQVITLTGNVTSSTLSNIMQGQDVTFLICQDATGGHTFVWPTTVKGGMTIGTAVSTCSVQSFTAASWGKIYATSAGVPNL